MTPRGESRKELENGFIDILFEFLNCGKGFVDRRCAWEVIRPLYVPYFKQDEEDFEGMT